MCRCEPPAVSRTMHCRKGIIRRVGPDKGGHREIVEKA
jgi:hypothetical protein